MDEVSLISQEPTLSFYLGVWGFRLIFQSPPQPLTCFSGMQTEVQMEMVGPDSGPLTGDGVRGAPSVGTP